MVEGGNVSGRVVVVLTLSVLAGASVELVVSSAGSAAGASPLAGSVPPQAPAVRATTATPPAMTKTDCRMREHNIGPQ